MDGNNRWSKKNKTNKYIGYKQGAKTLIKLTDYIFENSTTKFVSAFALSTRNLNRSKNLILTLKKVLLELLSQVIEEKLNNKFNIKFIGDKSFLNSEINSKIDQLENLKKKTNNYLLIYINYSGKDDILKAVQKYNSVYSKKNKVKFEDFLLTNNYPDPDILIRSGSFNRLSDFMIYNLSFTELFFTRKLWPDLKKQDLLKIIEKYYLIERKFGL